MVEPKSHVLLVGACCGTSRPPWCLRFPGWFSDGIEDIPVGKKSWKWNVLSGSTLHCFGWCSGESHGQTVDSTVVLTAMAMGQAARGAQSSSRTVKSKRRGWRFSGPATAAISIWDVSVCHFSQWHRWAVIIYDNSLPVWLHTRALSWRHQTPCSTVSCGTFGWKATAQCSKHSSCKWQHNSIVEAYSLPISEKVSDFRGQLLLESCWISPVFYCT